MNQDGIWNPSSFGQNRKSEKVRLGWHQETFKATEMERDDERRRAWCVPVFRWRKGDEDHSSHRMEEHRSTFGSCPLPKIAVFLGIEAQQSEDDQASRRNMNFWEN